MTNEKLKSLFAKYADQLHKAMPNARAQRCPESMTGKSYGNVDKLLSIACHILWMCETATGFVDDGRTDKAFRWLGFIQGVLWADGSQTLEQLKNDSRPDGEAFDGSRV